MATTYVPTYAAASAPVVPRGGTLHLDRDLSAGTMGRNALGRPGLCAGVNRLVSRIVRAYLTDLGDWWADPSYGSAAVPGVALTHDVAFQVAQVALHEARSYALSPLSPNERIASVTVLDVQQAGDPRNIAVTVTIATVGQAQYTATLQF